MHFTSWRLKIQGVEPRQFSLGLFVDNNQGPCDTNYIFELQQTTFKLCLVSGPMRYAATPKLQNSFVVTIGAPGAYVQRPTRRLWCVRHTYNMLQRFDGFVFYYITIFKVCHHFPAELLIQTTPCLAQALMWLAHVMVELQA